MLKHKKELSLIQLGSHLHIEKSLRAQEGEKPKNSEAGTSSINMMEEGVSSKSRNKRKRSFNNKTYNGSNKKFKSICWNCSKAGHLSRYCRAGKDENKTGQNRLGQVSKDQGPVTHQGQISDFKPYPNVNYVSKIYEPFYVQDDEVA